MRSSKTRSRSKSNRNRSMGNIVNRVFDSSGPEGKVRGTPQQIIDKYNQLARDAQLGNDRVAAENFQQHAEHYLRMLAEAQREQEARREQQQNRDAQNDGQQDRRDRGQDQRNEAPAASDPGAQPQPDVAPVDATMSDGDSGLVETPESKPSRPRRQRRPRQQDDGGNAAPAEGTPTPDAPEAAE